jgi:transcriptional regulator with XRE-family HTH domain
MDYGRKIKELRKAEEWTQQELADRAQITKSMVSYIESGKRNPNTSTLEKIVKAFGMTLAEFYS